VTICIAAIAQDTEANNDVVITASDRMITLGGTTEYTWGLQTKTFWFSNQVLALVAGDPESTLEICRGAYKALHGKPLTVERVARKVSQKFREFRHLRNERRILSPYGLTFETLITNEQTLAQAVVTRIVNQLCGYEGAVNATMIVAGLDEGVGHIYLVEDPGDYTCCDSGGFAAVGMGREHAESVFTETMYTDGLPWTEVVLLVYLAKKRAEVAPGVGPDTDLYWIRPEGYSYVEPHDDLMRSLSRVRRDLDRQMKRAVDRGHRRLRDAIENFHLSADR
jgi:20S proteasome alpha/beta subunit